MILQSLYELYDRLRNDADYKIAPSGYSLQKIAFRVVLKPDGNLHAIEDARIKNEKGKMGPRQVKVPGQTKSPGSGFNPGFLWDTSAYMLGYKPKDENSERTVKAFNAFREKHTALACQIQSSSYTAVCRFLEKWDPKKAVAWPVLDDVGPGYGVFQIVGETAYVHDDPEVQNWWLDHQDNEEDAVFGQCLITGKPGPISRLQYKIKRVGAQAESLLVSFNDAAYESYGKEQSFNAPVSEDAAFRYATALNALLDGPMSYKHRFTLGDATVVFWTKEHTNTEDIFAQFASGRIVEPDKTEAQDETMRQKIELFLKALRKGREAYAELDSDTEHTPFFLLGLTGQAKGRIGVRFFHHDSLSGLLDNLRRHYTDIMMVRRYDKEAKWPDPEFSSLWQILDETCPRHNGKTDRDQIPPILEGPLLHAVLMGAPYPAGLYSAVMRRLHADREINYVRACVIAGYLRRNLKKEVSMSLDVEKKEPAYRLGRLFAVLEKVQGEAIGKATIRGSFYSAASATPCVVFPRLLRTYQHHLANPKIEVGLKIGRERLVQEILAPLTSFPAHLNLAEQGLFALGYYHQAKDLWTSKEDKQNNKGE
ncbi:MAG: type I-C CRISPR-associated protein Cas8c/Csd1 [Kiritimatiellae bacterium]|nr:type I-C CRISPR-associated protein Cas8c/Csd1 [Verrucomicrobiota bacterium]MCG2658763.1 type I-C CRISPR-associated protein Cas8c/Csd1 [Kiritimatiellia bacterium]